jgi:hypothetical protein
MQSLEMGGPKQHGDTLIDRLALRAGLPEVSKERLNQTLCAEHAESNDFFATTPSVHF